MISLRNFILVLMILSCVFSISSCTVSEVEAPVEIDGQVMAKESLIYGVTIVDVAKLDDILLSIKTLPKKMYVRIVFDENKKPEYYAKAVKEIGKHALIMGEILDSFYVKDFNVSEYQKRVKAYVDYFGDQIAIWEIGNEVNGEWLLKKWNKEEQANLNLKLINAFNYVKAKGHKTAITFYYNGLYDDGDASCWDKKEAQMQVWIKNNLNLDIKENLDYAFISFYDEDCKLAKPNWDSIFKDMSKLFPNAKLGIGEYGPSNSKNAKLFMDKYFNLKVSSERYIFGGFYWYFNRDMVPMNKAGWKALQEKLN